MDTSKDLKKILIILSVFAVAIFFLHYLMYSDTKSKSEKIYILQSDLSMKSERQNYLIFTERTLNSLEGDLNKVQDAIVEKQGEIKFIEKIESLARRNDLSIEIDSLVVQDQDFPSADLAVLNLRAKTVGSWANIYTFLVEVESLPFKLKINKTAVVKVDGAWNLIVEISVLKYK